MDRILLTLGTLMFAGVCCVLMLKGWRSRRRRQSDLPEPVVASGVTRLIVAGTPGLFDAISALLPVEVS